MNRRVEGSGLTVVEVLIAVALKAIVFAALAAMQVNSLRMTRASQQSSEATQIAVDQLNELTVEILDRYVEYQGCPGSGPVDPGCTDSGRTVGDFSVAHSISRGSGYESSGLIQVSVSVTGPASASLSTLVSCMDHSTLVLVDPDTVPDSGDEDEVSQTPTIREPGACAP